MSYGRCSGNLLSPLAGGDHSFIPFGQESKNISLDRQMNRAFVPLRVIPLSPSTPTRGAEPGIQPCAPMTSEDAGVDE